MHLFSSYCTAIKSQYASQYHSNHTLNYAIRTIIMGVAPAPPDPTISVRVPNCRCSSCCYSSSCSQLAAGFIVPAAVQRFEASAAVSLLLFAVSLSYVRGDPGWCLQRTGAVALVAVEERAQNVEGKRRENSGLRCQFYFNLCKVKICNYSNYV